jgi:endonuclease III related protein
VKKIPKAFKIYEKLYDEFGPRRWWPAETPFEVMVGAVLTQNTSWTNVEKAILNLKERKLLDPERLNRIPRRKLAGLIKPSGYYNVKAKRLKSLVGFLMNNFRGDIALMRRQDQKALRKKLLLVHGIGPETCDSIMLYALNKPFFVIDAYTKRIFSRCGLAKEGVTYDELQRFVTEVLPHSVKLYNEYHALIVQLGKDICRKRPKCNLCPLNKLCERRCLAF